jgi:beta-carotene hydroxylase
MTTVAPPALAELGPGLVGTGRWQRRGALGRPYAGILLFAGLAAAGWWWATPLCMFVIFVAVVTVTHDAVHGCLGLRRRSTDWALFALGLVLLESGHAYRITHLQHHRTFPGPDDPEGYPARLSFLGACCYGPVFLVRLWFWAYRRADRGQRRWLAAEACAPLLALVAGVALWPLTKGVLVYVAMAVVGSWVYPLLTVYLPHHDFGDTPWTQTRTVRGRLLPKVFLELTYHLEHHLYPQVPSHRLPELSRRLEPVLRAAGVTPRRVP